MIKAVIFDCFGVLLTDAVRQTIEDLTEDDPKKSERILELIRQNNRGFITPEESYEQISEVIGITAQEWQQQMLAGEARNARLLALIPELKKRYKTALLSNVGKGALTKRFSENELHTLFDVVVASGEVGVMKPDRRIYDITAQRLGVSLSSCVFIDDIESYADAAKEAGMQAIHYTSFRQFEIELEQILAVDAKD